MENGYTPLTYHGPFPLASSPAIHFPNKLSSRLVPVLSRPVCWWVDARFVHVLANRAVDQRQASALSCTSTLRASAG